MNAPLLATAWLASPLAGDPPQLDALLEWLLSPHAADSHSDRGVVPHCRVDRNFPAPVQGAVEIPLGRAFVGPWLVGQCSNPILPLPAAETAESFAKRISVENAPYLRERERKVVQTTNSWTKSYRLPIRTRLLECVRWFCFGQRDDLMEVLAEAQALGKKVAHGYGRVRRWTVESTDADNSWFARSESGTVLMRTLPATLSDRPWLPEDLVGFRRHFGACVPPYWHPERFTEVVQPC